MAMELEVKCKREISREVLIPLCKETLRKRFALKGDIVIESKENGDISIFPDAIINLDFYQFNERCLQDDDEEIGLWANISMNPSRTKGSFLLGLAMAIVIAEKNESQICNDSGLLGPGRFVNPNDIWRSENPGDFWEIAQKVADFYGICRNRSL